MTPLERIEQFHRDAAFGWDGDPYELIKQLEAQLRSYQITPREGLVKYLTADNRVVTRKPILISNKKRGISAELDDRRMTRAMLDIAGVAVTDSGIVGREVAIRRQRRKLHERITKAQPGRPDKYHTQELQRCAEFWKGGKWGTLRGYLEDAIRAERRYKANPRETEDWCKHSGNYTPIFRRWLRRLGHPPAHFKE